MSNNVSIEFSTSSIERFLLLRGELTEAAGVHCYVTPVGAHCYVTPVGAHCYVTPAGAHCYVTPVGVHGN